MSAILDKPELDAPIEPKIEAEAPPKLGGRGQIIRNVLVNWTAFLVTLLTGFWMSPFLIRNLGESVYGVWILVGSVINYLGLLDFGITQSTTKFISEHRARGDQNAINRIITAGLCAFSAVALLSLVASAILALTFNRIFHTELPDRTIAIVVALVGLNLAISFPASVFLGVLRGFQRYDIGATATSVSILFRCGFIVWAIHSGQGLIALAALTLIFDAARLVYVVWRVWQINPAIRVGRAHFQRAELQRLFGHSVWIFLIIVGDQINFATDSIIIGLFLPPVSITIYFIASRLVGYLRSLVVEMVGVLMPAVSGLHARDDAQGVESLLVAGAKFTFLLALPPAAVFFLLGDRFIALWIGPGYAQSAILLSILAVGILAHLCELTVTTVLVGMGHAGAVARWVLAQSLVNLALSLLLIKPLQLTGVALATSISMTIFALVSIPFYFQKYLQISLGSWLKRALFPPLLAQIPWIGALFFLKNYVDLPSMSAFFGALLLLLPFYAASVYFCALESSEKAIFAGLTARLWFKARPARF